MFLLEQGNRNILRDDSGHLKVADFGVSKLLKVAKTVKEDISVSSQDTSCTLLPCGLHLLIAHVFSSCGRSSCNVIMDTHCHLEFYGVQ